MIKITLVLVLIIIIASRERRSRIEQGSSKQNLQVLHTCHDTSFRSNLRGNRRTLDPWIIGIYRWTRQENFPLRGNRRTLDPWIIEIYRWTRQENFPNYTRTIGNTNSFPKAAHIAAERKGTSIQKHVRSRVIFVPGNVPFQTKPNYNF